MRAAGVSCKALVASMWMLGSLSAGAFSIDFVPASASHSLGGAFTVDVVLTGLETEGRVLSGFDIEVAFDPSILQLIAAFEGNALCDQSGSANCQGDGNSLFFATPGPDNVELIDLSLLTDAQLAAQQGDELTLATLRLRGISLGSSALTLLLNSISGATGPAGVDNLLVPPPAVGSAAITITPNGAPEPGSLLLLLSALLIGRAIQRKTR
jgi:hypothetical protein